jgi:UDPglucose 6-dehydrogenase
LKAFSSVARETGYDFRMLQEVMQINAEQRSRFLRKVRNALWTLKGKRLAVLGLAFKGGTDDIRESPAIEIVKSLAKEGCEIRVFDPAAAERAKEALPAENLVYASSAYEAATGADALLILTDWPEFAKLDLPRLKALLTYPIVVDGRNMYDPAQMAAAGFIYSSVGRSDVQPSVTRPLQKSDKMAMATQGKAE